MNRKEELKKEIERLEQLSSVDEMWRRRDADDLCFFRGELKGITETEQRINDKIDEHTQICIDQVRKGFIPEDASHKEAIIVFCCSLKSALGLDGLDLKSRIQGGKE